MNRSNSETPMKTQSNESAYAPEIQGLGYFGYMLPGIGRVAANRSGHGISRDQNTGFPVLLVHRRAL
jgi:hypothetical protein